MMNLYTESQAPRDGESMMIKTSQIYQKFVCVTGSRSSKERRGFTLLEVVVAAAILGLGLLGIVRVFPIGLQAAQRSEDFTRASLLARSIFEGLKADEAGFPAVTAVANDGNGNEVLVSCPIPLPGNGYDDDGDWYVNFNNVRRRMGVDLNGNGRPDINFDGFGEAPYLRDNGVDDDGDGIVDDNGDGLFPLSTLPSGATSLRYHLNMVRQPDGNLFYDPEPCVDDEICNGIDDDRDGLIDEDCRLASVFIAGFGYRPVLAGDGVDNDGDGQVDEELFDYQDRAVINSSGKGGVGDGMIDEDCGLARFPWGPARLAPPDDQFSWQVFVGVVPDIDVPQLPEELNERSVMKTRALRGDLGNAVDDDGDGAIDEELLNGWDDDNDGLIDEDCSASASTGWRRVEIVITWGGDGEDDDGDRKSVHPQKLTYVPGRGQIPYGPISWGVDEEERDGLDNDLDGQIDEDCYEFSYKLIGYLPIKSNPDTADTRMVMSYMGP